MSDRWHATELTVKWRSTDRLLSPIGTFCVLSYLLLEPHWSPHTHTHSHTHTHPPTHPPTERSILARCIAFILQIELHKALGYFQTGRNRDKQRKWGKCRTTTNNKKRTAQTIKFDPRPGPSGGRGGRGLEGRGELKRWERGGNKGISFLFWNFSLRVFFEDRKDSSDCQMRKRQIQQMVRWINQPKNIYLLFFGVQSHLIFHRKLPGLGKF